MATGYDNREATRASFAFTPQQARQTRTTDRQVQSGRTGVVGAGEARGGVVQSENPTLGSVGPNIPAFLETIFEPALKKQAELRMYQGYQAAVSGKTMEQIGEAQPALSSLFGQTDFEKGASFYHAQNGLAQWQAEQIANMDALKRLPPDQLGKVLYDGASKFLTGDTETDNAIHRMVIEKSQTLLPQVTTARIAWRREEGVKSIVTLASTQGENLNTMMDQARTGAVPLDATAFQNARLAVAQAFVKPDNLPEDAWVEAVEETARGYAANGNIAALTVMTEGGASSLLFSALGRDGESAAKYQAILNLAEKAGKDANTEYATQPAVAAAIDLFWAKVERGDIFGTDIRKKLEEFNAAAKTWTGSDEPLFDDETITNGVRSSVREQVAIDRADAKEEARWARDPDNPANAGAQAEMESTDIRNLISRGQVAEAEGRYTTEKVNATMRAWYLSAPVPAVRELVRAHQQQGARFPGVAEDIQSKVSANVQGGGTSTAFREAHNQWSAFKQAAGDGVVARAYYYGDYDRLFDRFDQLSKGGLDPLTAYQQTFGQPGALAGTQGRVPRATGNNAKAIEGEVAKMVPRIPIIGVQVGTGPTAASQQVILDVVSGRADERVKANPSMTIEQAVAAELDVARGARLIDNVGSRYWHNVLRGPSISEASGISPDILGPVWEEEVKEQFKANYAKAPSNYEVAVGADGGGNPLWTAMYTDEEGVTRIVRISPTMLRMRRDAQARARVNSPSGRNDQFSTWISEPGISLSERTRRVNSRSDFLAGRVNLGQNAPR